MVSTSRRLGRRRSSQRESGACFLAHAAQAGERRRRRQQQAQAAMRHHAVRRDVSGPLMRGAAGPFDIAVLSFTRCAPSLLHVACSCARGKPGKPCEATQLAWRRCTAVQRVALRLCDAMQRVAAAARAPIRRFVHSSVREAGSISLCKPRSPSWCDATDETCVVQTAAPSASTANHAASLVSRVRPRTC